MLYNPAFDASFVCGFAVYPNSSKFLVATFSTTLTTPLDCTLVTSLSSFCAVNLDSRNSGGAFKSHPRKSCTGADASGVNMCT